MGPDSNRPMFLSRRKLSQQTRKTRSVDFLLISLDCHFCVFLTWFQGETDPIHWKNAIVTDRLRDLRVRRDACFVSEPFLDLEHVEGFGFDLGFN